LKLITAALNRLLSPGVVDEDLPHQACRHSEKMRTVLPGYLLLNQAQVGFVDKRCGLQGVSRLLTPHIGSREAMQFFIDKGHQLIQSCLITIAPIE
jgi:hypothetical protein